MTRIRPEFTQRRLGRIAAHRGSISARLIMLSDSGELARSIGKVMLTPRVELVETHDGTRAQLFFVCRLAERASFFVGQAGSWNGWVRIAGSQMMHKAHDGAMHMCRGDILRLRPETVKFVSFPS